MTVAGAKTNPFSGDAMTAVYRASLGLPRQVCQLCDMALLAGYTRRVEAIDEPTVREAASGLRIETQEEEHAR